MNKLFAFIIGCTFMVIAGFCGLYEILTYKGQYVSSSKESKRK